MPGLGRGQHVPGQTPAGLSARFLYLSSTACSLSLSLFSFSVHLGWAGVSRPVKYINEFLAPALCTQVNCRTCCSVCSRCPSQCMVLETNQPAAGPVSGVCVGVCVHARACVRLTHGIQGESAPTGPESPPALGVGVRRPWQVSGLWASGSAASSSLATLLGPLDEWVI